MYDNDFIDDILIFAYKIYLYIVIIDLLLNREIHTVRLAQKE